MRPDTSVLLIAEFFPPDTEYAAFAERCRALTEKFGTSGLKTSVMILRRSPEDLPASSSNTYTIVKRNRAASEFFRGNLPLNMIQRTWAFFDMMRAVRSQGVKAIVISAHDPLHYVSALTAAKLQQIPVVTDAHDSWLVLGASSSSSLRHRLKQGIEQFAMRSADRIWVPTRGLANLIQMRYRIPSNRLRVVENGVSSRRFQAERSRRGDGQLLLHLGGPRAYYDSSTLVRAFREINRHVPEAVLVFLGVRDDAYTQSVRELCSNLGIAERVQFLPPVPPDAVPAFTRRACVGIHTYALDPALAATIGLKVMEYMAAGLPVLHRGPRGGETWTLVERCGVGLCAESEHELVEQAIALLKDSEARTVFERRSQVVAKEFEWSTVLEVAVADLRDLTGSEDDQPSPRV